MMAAVATSSKSHSSFGPIPEPEDEPDSAITEPGLQSGILNHVKIQLYSKYMGSSSLEFKFPARANFRSGKIITLSLLLNLQLYFHRGNQVSLERNIVTSEWYLFVNLGHFPWNRK